MKQFVIKAYDGEGKLDKRMEVRPRHFEGMEKMKEHILCAGGMQCLQVANQSSSLRQLPEATNRVNTIFMTTFFIGGSLGTFFSGLGWNMAGWIGVCLVGGFFACASLALSAYERYKIW